MDVFSPSTEELHDAWRDAELAAELADRLAAEALDAADHADGVATASADVARLAAAAADAAERAAHTAREAASRARDDATAMRRGDGARALEAVQAAGH